MVGSLSIGLYQICSIYVYPDETPQNNDGMGNQFCYKLDIKVPA